MDTSTVLLILNSTRLDSLRQSEEARAAQVETIRDGVRNRRHPAEERAVHVLLRGVEAEVWPVPSRAKPAGCPGGVVEIRVAVAGVTPGPLIGTAVTVARGIGNRGARVAREVGRQGRELHIVIVALRVGSAAAVGVGGVGLLVVVRGSGPGVLGIPARRVMALGGRAQLRSQGGAGRRVGEDGGEVLLLLGLVGGEDGGHGGAHGHVGVHEVGAGPRAAHGPGGLVVGQGGLLGRVERAEPVPLLGGGVPYLGRVTPPGATPDAQEPSAARGRALPGLRLLLLALGGGWRAHDDGLMLCVGETRD